MFSESKKIHIIEEILKIKNENTLSALENFLKKSRIKNQSSNASEISSFSGIWSKVEAENISKAIVDSCKTIHPDDWK